MSKLWIPSPYKDKCMEIHLTNSLIHNHDLACGCRDPLKHCLILLLENGIDSTLKEETKQKIKCLLLEDGTGDEDKQIVLADPGDFDLDAGDLDALFTADTEPEEDG